MLLKSQMALKYTLTHPCPKMAPFMQRLIACRGDTKGAYDVQLAALGDPSGCMDGWAGGYLAGWCSKAS